MIVKEIDTSLIDVPDKYADRKDFSDDIDESSDLFSLASNIEQVKLIHPIVVREKEDGRYLIVAGKRRLAAYKMLRVGRSDPFYDKISASILTADDNGASYFNDIMATLSENRHRRGIDPLFFANTFFAAITISLAGDNAIENLSKDEIENIGKSCYEQWHYFNAGFNVPKTSREVVERFINDFKIKEPDIIDTTAKIIASLGYSPSGIKKKIKIVFFDENLQKLIRTNNISYALAVKADLMRKKKESKARYDAFIKQMINAIKNNEDVTPILDTFFSSKKVITISKSSSKKIQKQMQLIVDKMSTLPPESEKFISIKRILDNVEKELSK